VPAETFSPDLYTPDAPLPTDIHTFDLVYTQGNNKPEGCPSVKTTIKFVCNTESGRGSPVATEVMDRCRTVFTWTSVFACHKCLDSELVTDLGACIDGQQVKSYRYLVPCYGTPPVAVQQACEDINLAKNTAIFAVSVVAIVLVLGLASALFFFQQKRTLEAKYELLKTEANVDSDDEPMATPKDKPVELDEEEDDGELPVNQDEQ